MSTESEEGRRIVASLAFRVNDVADISQVADAIITMLQDADLALVPIIGPKGAAALHRRSLHLCYSKQPCLAGTYTNFADPIDLTELRSLLLQQNPIDAIFFGEQLLKALYELLATLIGPSLSARLLFDVWDNSLSAPPAQETSP